MLTCEHLLYMFSITVITQVKVKQFAMHLWTANNFGSTVQLQCSLVVLVILGPRAYPGLLPTLLTSKTESSLQYK